MKRGFSFLITIILLLTACLPVFADSPLTSTQISDAYQDIDMVRKAGQVKVITNEIAEFLFSAENPIDIKAAVINALGWDAEEQENVETYCELIYNKPLKDLKLESLSGEELFCIGYLTAMDDYFSPQRAKPILEKAEAKIKNSLTVSVITALVKAQEALHENKSFTVWKLVDEVVNNKALMQDLRPEAVRIILDYISLYSKDFELTPSKIHVEKDKSVTASIYGGKGPFTVFDKKILAENDIPVYFGDEAGTNVYSANPKVSVKISGNSITFKGESPGAVLVTLSDASGVMYSVPVAVTLPSLDKRLKGAIILYVGSSTAYINSEKTKIDVNDFDIKPVIRNGRTLLPIRFVSEKLGAKVSWNGDSGTAVISLGAKTAVLKPGENKMTVNSKQMVLDVPAQVINNRIFIPLRRLVEDVLDKKIFYKNGVIIVSDYENIIDEASDKNTLIDWVKKFESDFGGIKEKGGILAKVYATKIIGGRLLAAELDSVGKMMERKLDDKKIYAKRIKVNPEDECVEVELAQKYVQSDFKAKKDLEDVLNTEFFSAQEVDESKKDTDGNYIPTGRILISGADVSDAEVLTVTGGEYLIKVSLTAGASKKFEEATGSLIGQRIGFFMDQRILTSYKVNEKNSSGNFIISGKFSEAEAKKIASDIRAGEFPYKLRVESFRIFNSMN
ncbi:MAG: stalk domain-containing protein [Clostridia bacterium]|nr:stalk domain-containing protein [Clostridia bacterium]